MKRFRNKYFALSGKQCFGYILIVALLACTLASAITPAFAAGTVHEKNILKEANWDWTKWNDWQWSHTFYGRADYSGQEFDLIDFLKARFPMVYDNTQINAVTTIMKTGNDNLMTSYIKVMKQEGWNNENPADEKHRQAKDAYNFWVARRDYYYRAYSVTYEWKLSSFDWSEIGDEDNDDALDNYIENVFMLDGEHYRISRDSDRDWMDPVSRSFWDMRDAYIDSDPWQGGKLQAVIDDNVKHPLPMTDAQFQADVDEIGGLCGTAFEFECTAYGLNPSYSLQVMAASKLRSSFMAGGNEGEMEKVFWKPLERVYDAVKVVGVMLVFLYFIIDIIERVKSDAMTSDQMMRKILSMAIGILVVTYGFAIFKNLWLFGDHMIDLIINAMGNQAGDDLYNRLFWQWKILADEGLWTRTFTALGTLFGTLLYYVMQIVIIIVMNLVIYSRLLELIVRVVFAPIGVANMFSSGGQHAQGVVYMKKFASISLQGAVMAAIIIGSQWVRIALSMNDTGISGMLSTILLPLAVIGLVTKSKSLSDDIVGVH